MIASANAEPMKPPAPVSNIVLPVIAFSIRFSRANGSLHAVANCVSLHTVSIYLSIVERKAEPVHVLRVPLFIEMRETVVAHRLLPSAKQSSHKHELSEVVGVMVCRKQRLAQNGLPIAVRDFGKQVS